MIYQDLLDKKTKLALVGLGYVGMPIAVSFAKIVNVLGFDVNKKKIEQYKRGIDLTNEVGNEEIRKTTVDFTDNPDRLKEASFIIVAVPTPVNSDHTPDLTPVKSACELIGKNLSKGTIVVFESTVYPGVTEEVCIPIIEKESGLKCGTDWKIGYSPERINPGDKVHRLETITKVVSAMDEETLDIVARVYEMVVDAGVYRAKSIKVAEAAKVIENSQRDINIAFMNELSIIFHKMGIDTKAVLDAASTKWNFLKFEPGLVGGHCIGVDPYYLTYRAEQFGYHSQVILSGRRINDGMGKYVAENLVKMLIRSDINVRQAKVGILGITFKENCPDTRNTKVTDIYNELLEYGIEPMVFDPLADSIETSKLYNIDLVEENKLKDLDAVIVAVKHDKFKDLSEETIKKYYNVDNNVKIIMDLKNTYDDKFFSTEEWDCWHL